MVIHTHFEKAAQAIGNLVLQLQGGNGKLTQSAVNDAAAQFAMEMKAGITKELRNLNAKS